MTQSSDELVLVDASVLINLAILQRFDLLAALPSLGFAVPDIACGEVKEPELRAVLEVAMAAGTVRMVSFETTDELRHFAELSTQIGPGEAACLALAISREGLVACHERRAFVRIARGRLGPDRIFTTPGLMLEAIRIGAIDVDDADACKAILEQRRFRMRFASFRDLLP